MKKLALSALLVGLVAACGDDGGIKIIDSNTADTPGQCNPLTQAGCATGEKCTWLLDALMPQYVGHVGCAPDGAANIGDTCMFGAPGTTGIDNCKAGSVCGAYRQGEGICKAICDQAGGDPACDNDHVCVTYSDLFSTGESTPAAAGVCDHACDPIGDNDFDGSADQLVGSSGTRRLMTCGTGSAVGCYGSPSGGTAPRSGWSCTNEVNYDQGSANAGVGIRHRTQCVAGTGCTDPASGNKVYLNSCNQGYLPLIQESTEVSTTICVALCRPQNCYLGNCGANGINEAGSAGDGCRSSDRVSVSGSWLQDAEQCRFLWRDEIDQMGNYLPSPTSDTVGFCYSHAKYKYDKNGDPNDGREEPLPKCATLPDGFGSGSQTTDPDFWGAADLGCVDTTHALGSAAAGKTAKIPASALNKMHSADMPRMLYHREVR